MTVYVKDVNIANTKQESHLCFETFVYCYFNKTKETTIKTTQK